MPFHWPKENDSSHEPVTLVRSDTADELKEPQDQAPTDFAPGTLGTFASMLSHDLCSPLSAVIGYADLLLEGYAEPLTETQEEYVHTIRENAQRILYLITAFSDALKLAQGRLALEPQPLNINQVLHEIIDQLAEFLQARQQTIRVQEDDAPYTISADAQHLHRALRLLLRLAAQHAPTGHEISVYVSSPATGGQGVEISVKATASAGEGHACHGTTERRSSPPLPLFIARMLVEVHGGRLTWSPSSGNRELLRIELPALPPSSTDSGQQRL